MGKLMWIVGIALGDGNWMAEGLYDTEGEAAAAALDDEFILEVPIGTRFPKTVREASKIYWPKHETWETSKLYKERYPDGDQERP